MIAGVAFLLLSCGNEKKEEKEPESGSIVENVSNLSKLSKSADKMEELTNSLKKLTPLTNEELKLVTPETLNGLKRKSYTAGAFGVSNISSIEAEYGDDVKDVKINILDGAGESGSAIVSLMSMTLNMDTESESNGTITKSVTVNGIRAITEDTKSDQSVRSSIKYLYKDRYSISLDGTGYNLQELEEFMKGINTAALK
jgi:hypothetical protein